LREEGCPGFLMQTNDAPTTRGDRTSSFFLVCQTNKVSIITTRPPCGNFEATLILFRPRSWRRRTSTPGGRTGRCPIPLEPVDFDQLKEQLRQLRRRTDRKAKSLLDELT
jgi:hypothetical protein